jgi:hypothetical protein
MPKSISFLSPDPVSHDPVSHVSHRVLPDALMNAGFDPHAAWQLADAAYEQARHFGYSPLDKLPIPGITNLAR